jgi:hypothetical protein
MRLLWRIHHVPRSWSSTGTKSTSWMGLSSPNHTCRAKAHPRNRWLPVAPNMYSYLCFYCAASKINMDANITVLRTLR